MVAHGNVIYDWQGNQQRHSPLPYKTCVMSSSVHADIWKNFFWNASKLVNDNHVVIMRPLYWNPERVKLNCEIIWHAKSLA